MIDRDANPGLIGTKKPLLALKKALYKYYASGVSYCETKVKMEEKIREKKPEKMGKKIIKREKKIFAEYKFNSRCFIKVEYIRNKRKQGDGKIMNNEKIIDTDRRRKLKGFLGIVKRVCDNRLSRLE